jgi:hypothetical protein
MALYYEETALIEFVKQYTPTIEGETTLECVERAIRNAPTADVVPKKEIANVLHDLKIAVHNKAHYNHAKEVPTYITIRELDAILNNFIQNRKDVQNGR